MKLKVLPANVANMIAAGEVVQRPASVVKELMENSVDAGATQVSVVVTDSGRTLLQVTDNGCGMSPSDAVICFERHATSKIESAEDLGAILTYGFRGEALASIAAVSEVTLRTRRAQDETGTQVVVGDFGSVKTSTVSTPVGSTFAVRNLFYNTPARRKFLKSDSVEFKHIIEEFTRVAITRPDVGFSLSHNGRDIYVLKPAKSLKFRILDLMGSSVVGDVVDIEANTTVVGISGFVGRPDTARKTVGNQYFFINGRFFRSAYLHKAVLKAYEELMPEGLTPSYFIFLEADPQTVDVNIHPTKTEIKFEDDSVVFQVLYACIRETLGKNSFRASIDFDTEGAVAIPQLGENFEQYRGQPAGAPAPAVDPGFNPFEYDYSAHVDKSPNYGALFEQRQAPVSRAMIIQGKYIITPVASGIMVVNVARARERISYERNLKALEGSAHVSQTSLFPVEIETGAQNLALLEGHLPMLRSLGFDIVPQDGNGIVVNGVPEGFSCQEGKVRVMMDDILLILSEETATLSEIMTQRMAQKFALLAVSNAEKLESVQEAQNIIDTLFACDNAELTSGGKRIVCIIGVEELNSKF